jgi:hypothetical protein
MGMNLFGIMGILRPKARLEEETEAEVIRRKGALFQGFEDGKGMGKETLFSQDSDNGIEGEDIRTSELMKDSKRDM